MNIEQIFAKLHPSEIRFVNLPQGGDLTLENVYSKHFLMAVVFLKYFCVCVCLLCNGLIQLRYFMPHDLYVCPFLF